jgi:hypothetical protein
MSLELESQNFRVNSDGWTKRTSPEGVEYLESSTGIWQITNCKEHPELNGEQLFTWDAAMRETKKAGKRIPSDQEFSELLKTREDMPNLVFCGLFSNGSFCYLGSFAYFWASVQLGLYAWSRTLYSGRTMVNRRAIDKVGGFSVRCLKN